MITAETLSKRIRSVSWRWGLYDVFKDTIAMAAYSLANGLEFPYPSQASDEERRSYWKEHNERAYRRETAYLQIAKKYNKQEFTAIAEIIAEMFALLSKCTRDGAFDDYLGSLYMGLELGNKSTAQFFTPYQVSKMSAKMTIGNIPDTEVLTVADPTVGAGGMLLAAADILNEKEINYTERMLAYGCDVDLRCVQMAYLQLSLAGVPAIIEHGNSLTLEIWDVWETPAYLFNYQHFQPVLRRIKGEISADYIDLRPVIGPVFYF